MATDSAAGNYRLGALGLIIIIPLIIAFILVVSLIPLYLSAKTVTTNYGNLVTRDVVYTIPVPNSTPLGSLNDAQIAQLSPALKLSRRKKRGPPATAKPTKAVVVRADQVTGPRNRRQDVAKVLLLTVEYTGTSNEAIDSLQTSLNTTVQTNAANISAAVVNIIETGSATGNSTTSTITTSTVPSALLSSTSDSSTIGGRRRRRGQHKHSPTLLPSVTYKD